MARGTDAPTALPESDERPVAQLRQRFTANKWGAGVNWFPANMRGTEEVDYLELPNGTTITVVWYETDSDTITQLSQDKTDNHFVITLTEFEGALLVVPHVAYVNRLLYGLVTSDDFRNLPSEGVEIGTHQF